MTRRSLSQLSVFGSISLILVAIVVAADAPPPAPPVSKFAPAADLIAQSKSYAESFAPAMADSGKFKALQLKTQKDAHTLAVLGLALALSDEDHPCKKSSASLVAAAQNLATTTEFAAGQAAVAQINAALAEGAAAGDAASLADWQKIAPLDPLMKQVTFVYNRLKRGMQKNRFEQMADESARYAAILAVVGQVANYDTHEVKNPAELPEWYRYCGEMRDAAGEVNAAVRARQFDAATAAMLKLEKSCNGCHKVFRKDLVQ